MIKSETPIVKLGYSDKIYTVGDIINMDTKKLSYLFDEIDTCEAFFLENGKNLLEGVLKKSRIFLACKYSKDQGGYLWITNDNERNRFIESIEYDFPSMNKEEIIGFIENGVKE